eukprot:7545993-Pyramimonas_sp.AAC.1
MSRRSPHRAAPRRRQGPRQVENAHREGVGGEEHSALFLGFPWESMREGRVAAVGVVRMEYCERQRGPGGPMDVGP